MARMKRRAARPSGAPRPSSELVEELFRRLKLDDAARSFRAVRAFARAAGPRIGAGARAERLRGATLYVRASTSAWTHHLHALKAQLLDKLRRTPGGEIVP
jgi:predicted nucleic acid-binding Zn ribbon protein